MPTYIFQDNPIHEVIIDAANEGLDSDLKYLKGGGTVWGVNGLADDSVAGGGQWHAGNPIINPDEEPVTKKCDKATVTTETIKVLSAPITRGLFRKEFVVDPTSITDGDILKTNSLYFWDEVYTTPVGYFTNIVSGEPNSFEFTIAGNVLVLKTNDINIVPKIGDYIVMQKIPAGYTKPTDINIDPSSNPASYAGIFTDGVSNLPVIYNTETYQFKITDVAFAEPSTILTTYTLTIDKSLTVAVDDEYSIVLLNRENTGLQKELFYDTFETIEVHRQQLLGDPYSNTSTVKPQGRKNHLYYNNGQYLGIRNLLSGILASNEIPLLDTPFIVLDIDKDIKDRFARPDSSVDTANNPIFEIQLPHIMIQDDTTGYVSTLTNYGAVLNETTGVGRYSGLYMKWSKNLSKRFGWLFYDLRIAVIDDAELALAMGYNSNRNYTLPKAKTTAPGNSIVNPVSSLALDVIGLQQNSFLPLVVIVNTSHGLQDGDPITIQDVRTRVPGTNLIQNSVVNGVRYIKRFYTDPINPSTELLDRFYIYSDPTLTSNIVGDGDFVNSGLGQSGKIRGAKLQYNYFYTYRIKNARYSSILPYGELQNFNFALSSVDPKVDNTNGALYLSLPAFTYLNDGYEIDDLEFIIGEWESTDTEAPYKITGFKNVVVMSSTDITGPNSPSNVGPDTTYIITKSDYDAKVTLTNPTLDIGPYDVNTNPTGDPTYNIVGNYSHYNITNGTMSETLYTSEGKWTIGNVVYNAEVEQYRSKISIMIGADEWNDTTNPSYDPTNTFLTEKYITEVAIMDKDSDKPLIYAKIAPPIKKTNDLDIQLNLTIDF